MFTPFIPFFEGRRRDANGQNGRPPFWTTGEHYRA